MRRKLQLMKHNLNIVIKTRAHKQTFTHTD